MILCYDTVNPNFQGGVPSEAQAIIFYVDGLYANETGARARFPQLFIHSRAIGLTVRGRVAQGDDFEPGNWQGNAGEWTRQALTAGVWRPVLYGDGSDMDNLIIPELEAVFGRPLAPPGPTRRFRLILADPDGDPTIPDMYDGKQYWWGSIQGNHTVDMDITSLRDDFFDRHTRIPPLPEGAEMVATYMTHDNRVGFVVETNKGEVLHIEQQAPSGVQGQNADWWRQADGRAKWLSLGTPGS